MEENRDRVHSKGEDSQEYANFIRELLQAEESDSGIKVIYPMLAQRQHLLNASFAETLQPLAQILIAEHPEAIELIVAHIENLSIHIYQFPLGSRANNIEIAITGYQIVLNNRQPGSEKFAQTQNNLAVAYSDRINDSRAENLEQAIEFYKAALTVYTLEDFAEKWATTQNNLANAYSYRINGSRAGNLERAIEFYEAALTVRTLEDFREDWAMTQNNLAAAYSKRINGSRAENLEQAIEFYDSVLTIYTREAFPEEWAMTQNNLAIAYSDRINGSRAENLERAIEFYDAALTVYTFEDFPEQWAMTQNNLAIAYSDRINGSRAENLERAIEFYVAALTVYAREAFPEKWATTQNNLAAAYSDRINGSRGENLERAIEFYQAALTVYTLEAFPEKWAGTKNNLAAAYSQRINGLRAENLERAIEFYETALTVYTLEDFPENWAKIQNNLANAYSDMIIGLRAENLERAIEFYDAALTVYALEDFPEKWATTQNNLANAYNKRINGSRAENLERAIEFYEAALTVYTLEAFPFNNEQTLNNLGLTYLAKLDNINGAKLEDINQKVATFNSSYDTFKYAITGAENLRKLIKSGDEIKQKHDLEWDKLYRRMVQVCLDRNSNQEALEYAEANKARNLAELIAQKQEIPKTLTPITFSEITQLLTPNTALIEWYITDAEIITFVITYPDVLTVHRHRQHDELTDLVTEYRAAYKTSKTDWQKQLATYLQRLADILQITTILPPSSTHLILIPHWLLHLFPLHALPLSDGEFLLDKYLEGIQYAPSFQLLQQITIHPNFDQLLALQNPTSDLRYTDLEVASIAPKFALSQILPGDEASKTNLLEKYLDQLENAHCAHFSCHGSFNPDDPLKSFLILSGGIIPGDPELRAGTREIESDRYVEWRAGKTADIDKCLTLADILLLQFKHCRLVVLSACETALIDTQNRSDYIGLPTGFIHAGAMGTLASLWAVNDLSTALMMVKFYELLKPGVSIGKALHDTQRWFKSAATSDLVSWVQESDSFDGDRKEYTEELLGRYNKDEKPYGDVYHWAAFCAIGL